MSKFAILNLSCLLESVVLWRHLVAIKRQGDIRLTFVADNRPMALLSNRRIVETSTPSLLAIYFYVTSLYILVDDEYFYTFPLLFKSFIKVQFIHVDRFTNLCLQLIEFFNHSLGYSLIILLYIRLILSCYSVGKTGRFFVSAGVPLFLGNKII